MSARNLLRHVFGNRPRDRVSEDALPLSMKQTPAELVDTGLKDGLKYKVVENRYRTAHNTSALSRRTPEPFGLRDIAEEQDVDTPSSITTAYSEDTTTPLDFEVSSFSTRELIDAALEEAKMAVSAHLDTVNTTLFLLDALDGFSATITELEKEMLATKQKCEENIAMLEDVERAIEGMVFAGEA